MTLRDLSPTDRLAVAALIHHGSPYVTDYVHQARLDPMHADRPMPVGTAPEPTNAKPASGWTRMLRRMS